MLNSSLTGRFLFLGEIPLDKCSLDSGYCSCPHPNYRRGKGAHSGTPWSRGPFCSLTVSSQPPFRQPNSSIYGFTLPRLAGNVTDAAVFIGTMRRYASDSAAALPGTFPRFPGTRAGLRRSGHQSGRWRSHPVSWVPPVPQRQGQQCVS